MGVDAVIYAAGDLTPAEHRFMLDVRADHDPRDFQPHTRYYLIQADEFIVDRWYGPGYERGNWPAIYTAIRKFQAAYPKAKIYYTDDHAGPDFPPYECTPEYLERLWQHYLGPNGDDYHQEGRPA